jgi:hypothetical protein
MLILLTMSVSLYKFYIAFTAGEGLTVMLIQFTAGLLFVIFAWLLYKEKNMTRRERLIKWEREEEPRGMGVYILKWMFGWGLIAGFLAFSGQSELTEHTDLWLEGFFCITGNMVVGLFVGLIGWHSNRNEVRNWEHN